MVLAAGARAITHIPSMNKLETKLKLLAMKIIITFKQINIVAIQYAHSILVHK
jgi:hypothetical protein